MAPNVSVKEILVAGGPVLFVLILLSVYSVGLIWERWRFYKKSLAGLKAVSDKARKLTSEGDLAAAAESCRASRSPAGQVLLATLVGSSSKDERRAAAQRAIERAAADLGRGTPALGTIASTAPFIGLFGTVLGVMRAFRDLAGAAGAGPGVVAVGISEALICTAAGLFVAIPALAAYNWFTQQVERFSDELRWAADEMLESLAERARKS